MLSPFESEITPEMALGVLLASSLFPTRSSARAVLQRAIRKDALRSGQGSYHVPLAERRVRTQRWFGQAGFTLAPYAHAAQYARPIDSALLPHYVHEAEHLISQAMRAESNRHRRNNLRKVLNRLQWTTSLPSWDLVRRMGRDQLGASDASVLARRLLEGERSAPGGAHPQHLKLAAVAYAQLAMSENAPSKKHSLIRAAEELFQEALEQTGRWRSEQDENQASVLSEYAVFLHRNDLDRTRTDDFIRRVLDRLPSLDPRIAPPAFYEVAGDMTVDDGAAVLPYLQGVEAHPAWLSLGIRAIGAATLAGDEAALDRLRALDAGWASERELPLGPPMKGKHIADRISKGKEVLRSWRMA